MAMSDEDREMVERLARDFTDSTHQLDPGDPGPIGTTYENGKPPWSCHCTFETNSPLRWWLHRVRSWPFK